MICPECHHKLSCRIDDAGQHCHCACHDLADDAAKLAFSLATMTNEARKGDVRDVTAGAATKLLVKHNTSVMDKLLRKLGA